MTQQRGDQLPRNFASSCECFADMFDGTLISEQKFRNVAVRISAGLTNAYEGQELTFHGKTDLGSLWVLPRTFRFYRPCKLLESSRQTELNCRIGLAYPGQGEPLTVGIGDW